MKLPQAERETRGIMVCISSGLLENLEIKLAKFKQSKTIYTLFTFAFPLVHEC